MLQKSYTNSFILYLIDPVVTLGTLDLTKQNGIDKLETRKLSHSQPKTKPPIEPPSLKRTLKSRNTSKHVARLAL